MWAINPVTQLIVGNPQAQHIYLGPGDANGNEGLILYGPDGVTVLASLLTDAASSYFTAKTLALPVAGDGGAPGLLSTTAASPGVAPGALNIAGPLSSPSSPQPCEISLEDETGAQINVTANVLQLAAISGSPTLRLLGAASNISAAAFTASGFRSARATRTGTSDNFSAGSMVGLGSVTLPAAAPAGAYAVSLCCPISSNTACNVYYRVLAPSGANLTSDDVRPIAANSRYPYNWSDVYQHAGGAGTFAAYVQVSAGTGAVYNPPWHLAVAYLGS